MGLACKLNLNVLNKQEEKEEANKQTCHDISYECSMFLFNSNLIQNKEPLIIFSPNNTVDMLFKCNMSKTLLMIEVDFNVQVCILFMVLMHDVAHVSYPTFD